MRSISRIETTKFVRQALREAFPDVKFSIRSSVHLGYVSIAVLWTDGPSEPLVEAIAKRFDGGYVDATIDYHGRLYHELDGERVSFEVDAIFCGRRFSDGAIADAIAHVGKIYGLPDMPNVDDWKHGRGRIDVVALIRDALVNASDRALPASSKTAARVHVIGDDGYSESIAIMARGRRAGLPPTILASTRSAATRH